MTKREMFALIATLNADNTEVVEFCNHEIELIDSRKESKTPTKTQKENETLMDTILSALSVQDNPTTITNLILSTPQLSNLSNQKVSALMRKLVEAEKVVKTFEGKKALFALA